MAWTDAISEWARPVMQAGLNYAVADITSAKSFKRNRLLAEEQWNRNLEMWNMQNEYNNPMSQMKRLEEAGLNPNMLYGTGVAGATGQAKELPKYEAPKYNFNMEPVNIMGVLGAYQDIKLREAQVDQLREVTRAQRVDSNIKEETFEYEMTNAFNSMMKNQSETTQAHIKKLVEEWKYERGMQKKEALYNLNQSQFTAQKVEQDAYIRKMEADLFRNVDKMAGSGTGSSIMKNLIKILISRMSR